MGVLDHDYLDLKDYHDFLFFARAYPIGGCRITQFYEFSTKDYFVSCTDAPNVIKLRAYCLKVCVNLNNSLKNERKIPSGYKNRNLKNTLNDLSTHTSPNSLWFNLL